MGSLIKILICLFILSSCGDDNKSSSSKKSLSNNKDKQDKQNLSNKLSKLSKLSKLFEKKQLKEKKQAFAVLKSHLKEKNSNQNLTKEQNKKHIHLEMHSYPGVVIFPKPQLNISNTQTLAISPNSQLNTANTEALIIDSSEEVDIESSQTNVTNTKIQTNKIFTTRKNIYNDEHHPDLDSLNSSKRDSSKNSDDNSNQEEETKTVKKEFNKGYQENFNIIGTIIENNNKTIKRTRSYSEDNILYQNNEEKDDSGFKYQTPEKNQNKQQGKSEIIESNFTFGKGKNIFNKSDDSTTNQFNKVTCYEDLENDIEKEIETEVDNDLLTTFNLSKVVNKTSYDYDIEINNLLAEINSQEKNQKWQNLKYNNQDRSKIFNFGRPKKSKGKKLKSNKKEIAKKKILKLLHSANATKSTDYHYLQKYLQNLEEVNNNIDNIANKSDITNNELKSIKAKKDDFGINDLESKINILKSILENKKYRKRESVNFYQDRDRKL